MSASDPNGELPASVPIASTGLDQPGLELDQIPESERATPTPSDTANSVLREIFSGSAVLTILAIVLALIVGGVLIAATNQDVQAAAGYFFGRPTDTLSAIWTAVSGAYSALFQGGVYDFTATDFASGIAPLINSLNFATPLIAAGLGIAVSFRSGVFNIGGQGQVLAGAAFAGYVGFAWTLPAPLHMIVAVIAGLLGAAIWGGIVGVLKARTGAHEVILTIMFNYIAFYLLEYLLHTDVLRAPGSQNPQSPAEKSTAVFAPLLGSGYSVNFGFILVIVATVFCWWLLSRSSLGFKLRAVGENPRAARVAGIRINRMYIYVMLISGLLVGLAGVYQVLGYTTSGFGTTIDAGIGFSAITVALLGRSRPLGVFAAGILFGVLQGGSYTMQAQQGVNVNIVPVIQSVIVLFLAAPPLVRAIFHLPSPTQRTRAPRTKRVAVETGAAVK
jgi:simple sugar transport system permease protein